MIGNETEHLLKCVKLYRKMTNTSEVIRIEKIYLDVSRKTNVGVFIPKRLY